MTDSENNICFEPEEENFNEEESVAENESSQENQIKILKKKLKECEKQKIENLTGWQRAKADSINAKKDELKLREEIINIKTKDILINFLEIIDFFNIAFKHSGWNELDGEWKKGIEAVYAKFIKIFENYGVLPFESVHEQFNPSKHEAIMTEEINVKEKDHIILEEFEKGYNIKDKVLRPAKVKVGIYKNNQ